jgi:hypothetical protein
MDAEKDKETGATEPMEDMDCFFEKKGPTGHHLSYRIFCLRLFSLPPAHLSSVCFQSGSVFL